MEEPKDIKKEEVKEGTQEKEKKDLYCSGCKTYPDKVREVYNWVGEDRVWNPELGAYEIENVDYGDSVLYCDECGEILESKPQS